MAFDHILWLDLETRSRVDLPKCGAYLYRECPDHRILVAGYALDMGQPKAAIIGPSGRLPVELQNMLADKRVQVRAHNAGFDRLQLKEHAPDISRWYCTAAQARAIALPGKLDDLGRALKLTIRKDPKGQQLIRKLSIPDKSGRFNNDPRAMREFADYCAIDIGTMRAASLMMPELRDEDLAVYHANERVNDRGLPIDVELCRLAVEYAKVEAKEAARLVIELSDGALRSVHGTKLTQWVYDRLDPTLRKHMEVVRIKQATTARRPTGGGRGVGDMGGSEKNNATETITEDGLSLAVDIRATLLEIAEDNPDAIDPTVVAVIEAAEAGSMMSTAKFQTMLDRTSADGRLRGAFMFNGAYQTNRFSSMGAQVHNFPREVAKNPEAILADMRQGKPLPGVLKTLKSMLRPAIAPKDGKVIVRADWNAVEARGLPWLVNTPAAHRYMAAFTEDGRDVYVEQAEAAGLGPLRQPGKVVVLSLGYGGAEGALGRMAKNYGVRIDDRKAVVDQWRRANPWVAHKKTGWWAQLQQASMGAMEDGRRYSAGRVTLEMAGANLVMTLPSGRELHYPMAKLVDGPFGDEVQYLKASWKPKAGVEDWPTARLWYGVLAENADQAVCADLLRESLVRAEKAGIEVIGHVHDEVITEADPGKAKKQATALSRCMLTVPGWAKGFPLKVEPDISPRFRK